MRMSYRDSLHVLIHKLTVFTYDALAWGKKERVVVHPKKRSLCTPNLQEHKEKPV